MAKQNKSRKFFATTATAALVASAIVPVASAAEVKDFDQVPAWAKDAVKYLVDNGSVQGDENGNFNPTKNLTRAQAAEILMKELELEATGTENYTDVASNNWFYNAVLATSPEIFEGNEKNQFLPNKELTRQEAAKVLVEAYNLTGSASLSSFPDASTVPGWAKSYLETAVANGVMKGQGTNLAPTANITNAEFATMVKRAIEAATPVVSSVSAINSKTIVVNGTGLSKLTKEDIKVENNTVETVVVAANGRTATITLKDELVPDLKTKVTVLGTDYEVAYSINATKIAVKEGQFDDDTSNQFVKVLVDGKEFTAAELIANGYTVEFTAFASKAGGDITTTLFADENTGKLSNELDDNLAADYTEKYNAATNSSAADYDVIPTAGLKVYVQVKATKDTEVITSDLAELTVKNLDIAGDSISSVVLLRNSGENQFAVTSNKFVTGETFIVDEITVKTKNEEEDVDGSKASVKSSNAAVLSVKDGVVTAEGPGTATLTISYGGTTTTKTITVTNEERVVKSVAVYNGSTKVTSFTYLLAGDAKTFTVRAYDQFGDRIIDDLEASSSNKDVATVTTSTNDEGVTTLSVDPQTVAGSTIISFESEISNKLTGTLKFTTTANATVSKYRLVSSDDTTLDIKDPSDDTVVLTLQGLTSEDVVAQSPIALDADGYQVTINQSSAGVIASTPTGSTPLTTTDGATLINDDGKLEFTALKPGTVTVTIKDLTSGKTLVSNYKLTVVSEGYSLVAGSSFTNYTIPAYDTTIDFTDVFSATLGSNDPVIKGLKLSKATSYPVRLDLETADFYIDKDADGDYNNDDIVIGEVQVTTEGTFAAGAFDIADFLDTTEGLSVAATDEGTVIFKLVDPTGKVVETKSLKK